MLFKKIFILFLILFISCKKDIRVIDYYASGYPEEIGKIIINKCATPGCHNDKSKDAAGGISLSTWANLFEGSTNGAVVIPFRPDFSTLCYYINTDASQGPALSPTMPIDNSPLSKQEYDLIKDWVLSGAPQNSGFVKFSDDARRKKIYIPNYLCDEVTVFDSETLLPMRYIKVGKTPVQEFVYRIKVSPDNNNWYASFFSPTGIIQKFDATTDKQVGEINLGVGSWSTFDITSDSKFGFFVDNSNPGKIKYVDLNMHSVLATYTFSTNFESPKGIVINNVKNKIYVGAEYGNFIYVIDITNPLSPVITEKIIDGSLTVNHSQSLDAHFFNKTSDNKFCFVGCEYSKEVRMVDMQTDSVKGIFALPSAPAQMDVYEEQNLLFVACPNDAVSFPGNIGSVFVYNYITKTLLKKINAGFQPYGLGIDRNKNVIAVVNSNLDSGGPAPHHTTGCGGRNGYVTFIDLNTFALIPGKKIEVANYPMWAAVRN